MTAAAAQPTNALETPSLARRLAAFTYEGVLLFGVLMIAAYLYSSLTQQRHAMQGHAGLQAFLFVVLGIYFIWFWSHGGQTVAMRAWNVRLLTYDGKPVSEARAGARYLSSWVWFLPSLSAAWIADLNSAPAIIGLMATGVVTYALLSWLHPQRQFWHDALCGTRLVTWRVEPRRAQSDA